MKIFSNIVLFLLVGVAHGIVYEPLKELISLNRDADYRIRRFIANENSNIILNNIKCRVGKNNETSHTLRMNWALHYVPCGVKIEGTTVAQYGEACRNGTQTEFIASENMLLKCDSSLTNFGPLISEQLSIPTSFPSCANKSITTHRHSNSSFGAVASTWKSGSYILYIGAGFINDTGADWQLIMQVHVRTQSGGYLPAPTQPLLPLWGTMMAVYCIMVFTWLILCGKHWRGVVRLHSFITLAVFTGFIEAAFSLTVAYGVNKIGVPRMEWNIAAELAQAVKGTTLRVLLIVIAMGYGSTKANRFRKQIYWPLAFFGAFYFIAVAVPAVIGVLRPVYVKLVIYSRIPSVLANVISVTWITISLFKTGSILKQHDDRKKIKVYNILFAVMTFCFLSSVIFIACRIYIGISKPCPQWQLWWLDEAFWALIALAVNVSICILWRPSQTTLVWAYSSLLNDEDETFSRLGGERMSADSRL